MYVFFFSPDRSDVANGSCSVKWACSILVSFIVFVARAKSLDDNIFKNKIFPFSRNINMLTVTFCGGVKFRLTGSAERGAVVKFWATLSG